MTPDEKRAYGRGYHGGRSGHWPKHRAPFPPQPLVADLLRASRELRDGIDGLLATIGPDDPWERQLAPLIARLDEAEAAIAEWVSNPSTE